MPTFSRVSLAAAAAAGALMVMGAGCATQKPMGQMNEQGMEKPEEKKMGGMKMEPQTPPELTETQKVQLIAGAAAHEVKELTFDVVGGMFYYQPNEIRVKKGDKVKINFINAGGFHNFVLDEFNVKMDPINGGETKTVEFVADKTGSFEYYCSVGQHRQMGQKGTLIVE